MNYKVLIFYKVLLLVVFNLRLRLQAKIVVEISFRCLVRKSNLNEFSWILCYVDLML